MGTDGPVQASGAAAPQRALWRGKAWFWVPVVPLIALDLWSKAAAFRYVAAEGPQRVDFAFLPEPFGFSLVRFRNTGTIWGLGQDFTLGLIVLRCVALLVILWFVAGLARRQGFQQLVLGLIFAGAVGNLYDNFLMPDRGVRDFLYFFYRGADGQEVAWPAFNVADSCISVGAVLLLILIWREPAAAPGAAAGGSGKA
jgi:signal peptidase II